MQSNKLVSALASVGRRFLGTPERKRAKYLATSAYYAPNGDREVRRRLRQEIRALAKRAIEVLPSGAYMSVWDQLQTEMKKVRAQIESEFWASPVGAVVRASGSGITPKVTFDEEHGYLLVEQSINFVEILPRTQTIESSVLNQLLNSKLLTDAEKRSLLEEQGILKPKEVMPTPER